MVRHREPGLTCTYSTNCGTILQVAKRTYSGKTNLRMSPELHAHLAAIADKNGISLNQLLVELLAGGSNFKLPK